MNLTHHQMATRHMATEVEHINRMLHTRDLSTTKAKLMLGDAAVAAAKTAGDTDLVIKYGIHQNRAWFNIL